MAIVIPDTQPVRFYPWDKRSTVVALLPQQPVDVLDEGMYQFYDDDYDWGHADKHRIVVLDSDFAPLGEITPEQLTVGTNRVYTVTVPFEDYEDEVIIHIGLLDANTNRFNQNYIVDGDFTAASSAWVLTGDTAYSGGSLVTAGTNMSGTATYQLPLLVGVTYDVVVTLSSISGFGEGTVKNGATVLQTMTAPTLSYSFSFTATSSTLSMEFLWLGLGTLNVDSIAMTADYTTVTPQRVSSPFCIKNILSETVLIHGCASNDHFGLFFVGTGFVPRVRVKADINDKSPLQEVQRNYMPTGRVKTPYVQRVSLQELRIDWCPAYLINFITSVLYLDRAYVDNEGYTLADEINVVESSDAPEIKAYNATIVRRDSGVTFKRIINDPDTSDCPLEVGEGIIAHIFEEALMTHDDEIIYSH